MSFAIFFTFLPFFDNPLPLCSYNHTCADGARISCSVEIPDGAVCYAYLIHRTAYCDIVDAAGNLIAEDTATCPFAIAPSLLNPPIEASPCGNEPH